MNSPGDLFILVSLCFTELILVFVTWQSVRAACWWEAPAGLQGRWKPLSRGRGGLSGREIFPCCQSCHTAHHLPPGPSPRQVSLESVLEVMATKLPPPPAPLHPARFPGKKVCFHFISLALSSHPTSIPNLQNPLCSMSRIQPHACLSVPPTGPVPHPHMRLCPSSRSMKVFCPLDVAHSLLSGTMGDFFHLPGMAP